MRPAAEFMLLTSSPVDVNVTDVGWEGVPNWITAVASLLTLAVAVAAALFAKRAAREAGKQAEAASEQVAAMKEQLEIARARENELREQAKRQAEENRQAELRQLEARLDAIAPTVFARAIPRALGVRRPSMNAMSSMNKDEIEFRNGDDVVFELGVDIELTNVSEQVAEVYVTGFARGNVWHETSREGILDPSVDGSFSEIQSGRPLYLRPGASRSLTWRRTVNLVHLMSDADYRPLDLFMDVELSVRDLGVNVIDTLRFNADLRYFRRDGSRLVVRNVVAHPWTESVAVPVGPRRYDRLEAGMDGASPAGRIPAPIDSA